MQNLLFLLLLLAIHHRDTVGKIVVGEWMEWGEWSECSVTCDQGWSSRERKCTVKSFNIIQPRFFKPNMKPICIGEEEQRQKCRRYPCGEDSPLFAAQSFWRPWTSWSSVSVTCGQATVTRSRSCQGVFCDGIANEVMEVALQPCVLATQEGGAWTTWSRWSGEPCGKVVRRGRVCRPRGASCQGEWHQEKDVTPLLGCAAPPHLWKD